MAEESEEDGSFIHKARRRKSIGNDGDIDEVLHDDTALIKSLSAELMKDKPAKSKVKRMMKALYATRQKWIETETPLVSDIFKKYPPLENAKHVSCFFCICNTVHGLTVWIHSYTCFPFGMYIYLLLNITYLQLSYMHLYRGVITGSFILLYRFSELTPD